MKKTTSLLAVLVALAFLVSGCATLPTYAGPFDPVGTWKYTVTDTNGNTYDSGTLVFSGQVPSGSWKQDNYYHVEYSGSWSLNGLNLTLSGAESWTGVATGPNALSGTWTHPDASGTWKATR